MSERAGARSDGGKSGVALEQVVRFLDEYFAVDALPIDPAFSRFVPMVYDPAEYPWRDVFEPEFTRRFNGLMIRGAERVQAVWCVSFPSEEALERVLSFARPGDLVFSHHPIDMRCGDPHGAPGEGFVPIPAATLDVLRGREMSVYSCHLPLDTHSATSTSDALVRAIGGEVVGQFLPAGNGHAGRLCAVDPVDLPVLAERCRKAVGLPYVEEAGTTDDRSVRIVAVVAGGAGDAAFWREADRLGADCLVTGEVTSKIANEIGRRKQAEIAAYLSESRLAGIGLSHAGSEFVVMPEVAALLVREVGVASEAVPEGSWWR